MNFEAKMQNPICIKLGKNSNVILADENCKKEYSLVPGVMFGKEHYGFIIISDYNREQREYFYPTQCKIEAVGMEGGIVKIFEEGKKSSWRFTKTGNLEHSIFGDFTDEFRQKFDTVFENDNMFMGESKLERPLRIQISANPQKSMILQDEWIKKDYPLYPGVMLGSIHYGFILIFDTEYGKKEVVYPTQNRIDAIGIEGNYFNDLKVFENGKYHPWLFTYDGKFKKQASYNRYSKNDKVFVKGAYELGMKNNTDRFTLETKKK